MEYASTEIEKFLHLLQKDISSFIDRVLCDFSKTTPRFKIEEPVY